MVKIILKGLIIYLIISLLGFLPPQLPITPYILTTILILLAAVLLIIILVLVMDLKIFQAHHPFSKINYKNIEVSYTWDLNGGGIIFAYEFPHIISQKLGKVEHIFEYCAGPGFIGFNLLANHLCDRLTLADVNPKAIEAIQETIKNNNLQDRVTVYQSDDLDSIPETEQWDLVVGNPPWDLRAPRKVNIRVGDPQGRVHEKFYRDIGKFLKPNGTILFMEGGEYTHVNHFKGMIEKNGLKIMESFRSVPFLGIFQKINQYQGLKFTVVIFLRLCLAFRETYFIWSKKESLTSPRPI